MQQKWFMHNSHFITQNIKKIYISGWNLIKLTSFPAMSRTFCRESVLFVCFCFFLCMGGWMVQWLLVCVVPLSWFTLRNQQFYSPLLLHYKWKCQNSGKKANAILVCIINKNSFHLEHSLEGSCGPLWVPWPYFESSGLECE